MLPCFGLIWHCGCCGAAIAHDRLPSVLLAQKPHQKMPARFNASRSLLALCLAPALTCAPAGALCQAAHLWARARQRRQRQRAAAPGVLCRRAGGRAAQRGGGSVWELRQGGCCWWVVGAYAMGFPHHGSPMPAVPCFAALPMARSHTRINASSSACMHALTCRTNGTPAHANLLHASLQIAKVELFTDSRTRQTRGCGFVFYYDRRAAHDAIAAMHNIFTFPGARACCGPRRPAPCRSLFMRLWVRGVAAAAGGLSVQRLSSARGCGPAAGHAAAAGG